MRLRSIIFAMTMAAASAGQAEPAKAPALAPSGKDAPPVVLASAELDRPTVADQAPPAPVKRPRTARVTSCRCGDAPQSN